MWTLWHSWHIGNTEPFMHYVTRNHPIVGGGTWFVGQKRARLWCGVVLVSCLSQPGGGGGNGSTFTLISIIGPFDDDKPGYLGYLATKYLYNQTRDASLRLRRFHSIWARAINRMLDIFAVTTVWFVSSHWVLGLGWRRLDPSKMWGHHHQTRAGEGDFTVTRRINTSQSDTRETFQQWRGAQHYRYRSPALV